MKADLIAVDLREIFGDPISVYTRAQAIEDGVLIDVSETARPLGFRIPVAMTVGVFHDCIATDSNQRAAGETEDKRMRDLLYVLLTEIMRNGNTDRIDFTADFLNVDDEGKKTTHTSDLWSACGPGDNFEPVITIMLQGED